MDTGLLLLLLGANEERLAADAQVTGRAVENFVAMEVLRHAKWSKRAPSLYHYRRPREEIDLIAEDRSGNLSPQERDWRALHRLREARGEAFRCGVLLYAGEKTVPLGDRLFAVPISGLWASAATHPR